MQLTFKKAVLDTAPADPAGTCPLTDLRCGQSAILESLHLAADLTQRLMELGFFPGSEIAAAGCAPGGDPRVYRVDGSEIALRVETARHLKVRPDSIRTLAQAKSASSRP